MEFINLHGLNLFKCNYCNFIVKEEGIASSLDAGSVEYYDDKNTQNQYLDAFFEEIFSSLRYNNKFLNYDTVEKFVETIINSENIFVFGVGCNEVIARAFCMRLVHLNLNAFMIEDDISPKQGPNDCSIILSKTGESGISLLHVKDTKQAGSKVLTVTSNPNSSIAKLSDLVCVVKKSSLNKNPKKTTDIEIDWFSNDVEIGYEDLVFNITLSIFSDALISELYLKLGRHENSLKLRHSNME
jgi:6-phospho-3-hexuloisomerase